MSGWKGVFTFPVSTMDAVGEELDLGAFRAQIDYILDGGMHGITVLGQHR
jgi:dihydrodipicolinate synthase/N-acetylneuraminate lyase